MARPTKSKKIHCIPRCKKFEVIGTKAKNVIQLTLEQFEAIRLIDKQGLSQAQAAKAMEISRTTLQRTYDEARIKLAIALVDGCDIHIYGGNYKLCLDKKNKSKTNKEKNIMKIALPCVNNEVSGHFGHCENFLIFTEENGKIVKTDSLPSPEHKPGFLPNFLNEQGANVIIAGGIGGSAINILNSFDIEVITGATGDPKTAVEKYLAGELKSTGSVCHAHEHSDECGDHN